MEISIPNLDAGSLPLIAVGIVIAVLVGVTIKKTGHFSQNILQVLRKVNLFKMLNNWEIQILSQIVRQQTIAKGQLVFNEGSLGNSLFIVQTGLLRIFHQVDGEEKTLTHSKPGDVLGEISLLTGQPRSASALAVKESTVLEIQRDSFEETAKSYPQVKEVIWAVYSWRIFDLTVLRIPGFGMSADQRKIWYKSHLSADLDKDQTVNVPAEMHFIFIVLGTIKIFDYVKEGPLLVRLKGVSSLTALEESHILWLQDRQAALSHSNQ